MSMLAKVVKKHAATAFTPFSLPEIGADSESFEENSNFMFPNAALLEPVETPVDFASAESEELTVENIIQNARDEAARIVAQAEKDREMIEQAAREKGMQFVQNTIDSEVAAQMGELRTRLTETIDQISAMREQIVAGSESELVELAIEIANKIVAREVTIDREIALTLVKVSLKRLNSRTAARVHLHPDDFAFVQSHREKLDFHGSLDFVEDRSITVGGCLIRTDTGDIDARIESQFDEIAHGLLGA